ncbi:AtpZ/AtpI family protein [Pedobacter sp. ASV28]|jgi:F0F1-type ATP synthase assembly protein I|uniref:AtpZ/AtpI family protein n=1 Tax=Pedobacter sp. ASV28 TaxID=2795123 RepID=UPI0018ECBB81|nr:AtpZ/AtpI family protein [Pedobacter sp. ASV28]
MDNKGNKTGANYAKYTGMGFQMLATICVFVFIGYKIDEKRKSDLLFTAILGLVGVCLALFQVIRSLSKTK